MPVVDTLTFGWGGGKALIKAKAYTITNDHICANLKLLGEDHQPHASLMSTTGMCMPLQKALGAFATMTRVAVFLLSF